MTKTTTTQEIGLRDVWHLLTATATKLDQLYAILEIGDKSSPVEPSSPVTRRVVDHPFFGMASVPESVSDTMAHLRGDRYAL